MNLGLPIAVVAAVGVLAGSAGVVVAGSSGATTPEHTVAKTSVAATSDTVADTSLMQFATGSSQRLIARPAGTTDAPLGYYEYLPPDYDDDGSSPLLVFLHGYGSWRRVTRRIGGHVRLGRHPRPHLD
jgi:dipeptidyl aminopeptidase/acylaminoacyl peptidase